VKNRPFGIIGEEVYEPITITWDGDTTDKICVSMYGSYHFYKVSDFVPSLERF
jgi:hypothetical protein